MIDNYIESQRGKDSARLTMEYDTSAILKRTPVKSTIIRSPRSSTSSKNNINASGYMTFRGFSSTNTSRPSTSYT